MAARGCRHQDKVRWQCGRQRVNFGSAYGGTVEHRFRHKANEVADTTRGFKDAPALEAESGQRGIHGADDHWRRVMRVKRGGAGMFNFLLGQRFIERGAFFCPFAIAVVEDLGHSTPSHIFDQDCFFLGCRLS
jgi:hypothetical protein